MRVVVENEVKIIKGNKLFRNCYIILLGNKRG